MGSRQSFGSGRGGRFRGGVGMGTAGVEIGDLTTLGCPGVSDTRSTFGVPEISGMRSSFGGKFYDLTKIKVLLVERLEDVQVFRKMYQLVDWGNDCKEFLIGQRKELVTLVLLVEFKGEFWDALDGSLEMILKRL